MMLWREIKQGVMCVSLVLTAHFIFGQEGETKWELYKPKKPATNYDETTSWDEGSFQDPSLGGGSVMFFQDVRIQLLSDKYRDINEEVQKIDGYRVRLYSSHTRNETRQAKSKFMEVYPDIKTDLKFQTPFFNLLAGGYRTRLEAEKWLGDFKLVFPDAYIVKGKIDLPDLGIPEEGDTKTGLNDY